MYVERLYELKIKELRDSEFNALQKHAMETDFSPFGKFLHDLKGYDCFLGVKPLDKWEAFYHEPEANKILNGESYVTCKARQNSARSAKY